MTKRSFKTYNILTCESRESSINILFLIISLEKDNFMTEHLINKKMPRTKEQFENIREKSREKILRTALELFSEKGYKGTSINDIAKAAGISKGLAYNYFENKQQILEAVFQILIEEFSKIFIAAEKTDDPFEKIKTLIDTTFTELEKEVKFWRLYASLLLQPELKEMIEKIMGNIIQDAFKMIEQLFRKAGLKNPVNEAKILGAIIDGVSLHYMFDKDNYPLRKMKNYLIKKYSRENLTKLQ